jgi:hypothetical protein
MNSPIAHVLSRSTVATLLVGAALLLSACSTTSSAGIQPPADKSDKSVAFVKLHNEMVRLASEPSSWGEIQPAGVVTTAPAADHRNSELASNP